MDKFEAFKDKVFQIALNMGCTAAETYYVESEEFNIDILDGKADTYNVNKSNGCNVRVKVDAKDGYAFTQVFDDPEAVVRSAMDNARVVENGDEHPMCGKQEYEKIDKIHDSTFDMTEREKIDFMLETERRVKAADERVKRVQACNLATVRSNVRIDNTLGLSAKGEDNISFSLLAPVMISGNETKSSYVFRMGKHTTDMDALVKEAVDEAAMQFGASSVPTGRYRAIVRYDAMTSLLATFAPMFSAENAQKGMSLLNGKENETIASKCVTIMDDPFYGEMKSAFDAEGMPTKTKTIVDNGVLKTLLHNLKTAKKAGVESTGNAGRTGAAASISVTPTTFFIKPGEKSYDELVAQLGDGLILTSFAGLHSGANDVSGAFSLLAQGLLVENGKVVRPVEQITVASTFLELLQSILCVGNDIRMSPPDASGLFASPSVLVNSLMVSGK